MTEQLKNLRMWRFSCCILVILLLAACGPAHLLAEPPLTWQAANQGIIPHVAVTTIAIDPHNPQSIFAGVYGRDSLYASTDGGVTWQRAGAGVAGQPLFALLFDPQEPDQMWAGTADGLYRGAVDAARDGRGWQRVTTWPPATAVFSLHAANGALYAAGAHAALWMTQDRVTWKPLTPLSAQVGALISVVTAADGILVVGSDGEGLFTSRDQGQSWQAAPEIGETFVAALWRAPWDDRLLLARTRAGLFRSTDGAATWQATTTGIEGRVDAIASTHADQGIYLGLSTGKLLRSTDQGATWQAWGVGVGRDGMFNILTSAPGAAQPFYAGTQHGLYRSTDQAQSWQPLTTTVGTVRVTALAQAPDGALYLGNTDGVYRSTDQGEYWQPLDNGLPTRTVLALTLAPDDPRRLYAATEGAGVYHSADAGATWHKLAWPDFVVADLILAPDAPERLYARVAYERIYASDDGGATWTSRWAGMQTTTEIRSLVLSPHNADVLYAGGTVDLFKSEDGATRWQRMGAELAGQTIFYLAVDANQPETIYAGATKGLYRSSDAGKTWQLWGDGLTDISVTALAFHPTQPERIYAGTKYRGVYASDDGGQSWQPAHTGLSAGSSIEILLIAADGRWLYAATDQGFWRAALR